jgi:serine/threonine protein kinase
VPPETERPRLEPGASIGPYRVETLVGSGGMGEVYRARDTRLDRSVAMKVLPARVASDAGLRQRLEREAKALAALSHPHICPVYDVGHQDGVDYLVMEYLEGETLARRLMKGPLPLGQALRCGIEIADALDKAHGRGIVHRDLKPGNIMLTKGGTKLLDFGLAKLRLPPLPPGPEDGTATVQPPLTDRGSIVGTLHYMGPEQLSGAETDARSDIFAFGAVLYEMVTGRKAFDGKSQASVMAAILHHEPAVVSTLQPTSPPALDHLIHTCLEKDPEERWQSAHDMKRELAWIAGATGQVSSVGLPAAGATSRSRSAWVLTTLAVMAAVALAAVLPRTSETPRVVRFSIYPPPDVMFTIYGTSGSPQMAISPDGRQLAFVASRAGARPQVWLRTLDALTALALPGTEDASFPFWSPDSQSIGFFAERKLKRIEASGARLQSLCDAPNNRGGAWSRDGTIVFAPTSTDPLHRVPASGGVATPLAGLDVSRQERSQRFPSLLPDGRRFLYLSRGEEMSINLGTIGTKPTKRVRSAGLSAAFVPPGHVLFVRDRSLMAQSFDLRSEGLTGEPTAIAEPVGGSTVYHAAFSASETGVLAYASRIAPTGRLTWFDRAGRRREPVGPPDDYISFQLSPDQRRVAVSRADDQLDTTDLWLLDVARNVPLRFSHHPLTDASPIWSPDGSRIVFRSDRTATDELYIKAIEGEAQEEALPASALQKFPTDWSPDGRIITYHSPNETGWDLWTVSLSDRKPTPFLRTQFTEIQGRLSPGGRWMAYASDESGVMEVYVRSFPAAGDQTRVSSGGGAEPQWRADGKELFYMASDRRLMSVHVNAGPRFEAGAPMPLFETRIPVFSTPYRNNTYAATADGQRFLVNTMVDEAPPTPINIILNWPLLLSQ